MKELFLLRCINHYVPCIIGSEIYHSQENALNRQFSVQSFLYCKNQLLKSFNRQICGLHRYQNRIRRDQCIDCHHTKAWHTVDATPQGLRNVLIISATPYQWKHMIGQRTCRRNTDETRIVMLQIWQRLYKLSPILFAPDLTGPFCQRGSCMEKQMSCQNPISKLWTPADILKEDYPLLIRKEVSSHKD